MPCTFRPTSAALITCRALATPLRVFSAAAAIAGPLCRQRKHTRPHTSASASSRPRSRSHRAAVSTSHEVSSTRQGWWPFLAGAPALLTCTRRDPPSLREAPPPSQQPLSGATGDQKESGRGAGLHVWRLRWGKGGCTARAQNARLMSGASRFLAIGRASRCIVAPSIRTPASAAATARALLLSPSPMSALQKRRAHKVNVRASERRTRCAREPVRPLRQARGPLTQGSQAPLSCR